VINTLPKSEDPRSTHPTYLSPLLCERSVLAREAVKRRRLFDLKTLAESEIADHQAAGWLIDRRLTKETRMKRQKLLD
jgi:hypothetical protein